MLRHVDHSDRSNHRQEITALRRTVPYLRLWKGKVFVVKAGGAALDDEPSALAMLEQVEILHQLGIRVVLVHGGGPQASAVAEALGGTVRFVAGRRVTDDSALEAASMVLNGSLNTRLLALCRRMGLPAVGLSGVDGGLVRARRRPPVEVPGEGLVDYGHVGDIVGTDPDILYAQLSAGLLPIVSPLAADERGNLLNVNADTVAAAIAVGMGAEKLILLTGAPGVLEREGDPASRISYTDLAGLADLEARGCLSGGMKPKATAIAAAIRGGVKRVHVISQTAPDSLLLEVFTNEGSGTMIVEHTGVLSPAELSVGA